MRFRAQNLYCHAHIVTSGFWGHFNYKNLNRKKRNKIISIQFRASVCKITPKMPWRSLRISTISQKDAKSFQTSTRYSTRKYSQIPSTSTIHTHAPGFEGVCCDRQIPERPTRILQRTSCLFGPLWFLSVHSKTMRPKEILRVFRPAMTSSTTSTFKRSTCSVIHSWSWWLKTLSDHTWCTWRTWTCTCHLCCIPLHHQGWPKCLHLWWAFLQIAGKSCICHISNDAIHLVPWNKFRLLIPWHFQVVPCRRGPWLLLSHR